MTDENQNKVKVILSKQFGIELPKINGDTRIIEDLNADSLDIVELMMTFEDEFNITIPDNEVENIKTVQDIFTYIESKLNAAENVPKVSETASGLQYEISVWHHVDGVVRSVVDNICRTVVQRIYCIIYDAEFNNVTVKYASFSDLEDGESKRVTFSGSYLTMSRKDYMADWKRLKEEEKMQEEKAKENKERDHRYQEYLKLKAEFEP